MNHRADSISRRRLDNIRVMCQVYGRPRAVQSNDLAVRSGIDSVRKVAGFKNAETALHLILDDVRMGCGHIAIKGLAYCSMVLTRTY